MEATNATADDPNRPGRVRPGARKETIAQLERATRSDWKGGWCVPLAPEEAATVLKALEVYGSLTGYQTDLAAALADRERDAAEIRRLKDDLAAYRVKAETAEADRRKEHARTAEYCQALEATSRVLEADQSALLVVEADLAAALADRERDAAEIRRLKDDLADARGEAARAFGAKSAAEGEARRLKAEQLNPNRDWQAGDDDPPADELIDLVAMAQAARGPLGEDLYRAVANEAGRRAEALCESRPPFPDAEPAPE